jgi:hypothetical protein
MKPLVQVERMMGGGEQGAAVDHRRRVVEAEADPLDQRGKVPGIDHQAVDRGLPANRVETGAPGPGRGKRVVGHR